DEISTELRSLHVPQPQFAFRSSAIEPELIIAQVERAQPQLAANAVTLIAVSDTSVDYGLTLRWTIERASVDELTVMTPDWLEGRLEFTGEEIRKTSSAFTDDGRVRWSVSLENAIRGEYLLSAVATLPPPANGLVTAPEVHFEHRADAAGAFTDIPLQ